MAIPQTIDASAHATCWGMPPEVAHVVVGAVLFLFPILLTAFVVLLVRLSRKVGALSADLASLRGEVQYHGNLWGAKLYGKRDAMIARAAHRR